jgi:uncharacterized protein YjbI with pentapeptide repeats
MFLLSSILDGVDFKNADLTGVNFTGATLNDVNFTGAILDGAQYKNGDMIYHISTLPGLNI